LVGSLSKKKTGGSEILTNLCLVGTLTKLETEEVSFWKTVRPTMKAFFLFLDLELTINVVKQL